MGGTQSRTEVDLLTEIISEIAMTNIAKCSSSSNQKQTTRIVNNGWRFWTSYEIVQKSSINSSCAQDLELQAKLQNDIINAIAQETSAQGIALLDAFGNTRSEAIANLTNTIRNDVTMTNIMETVNTIEQEQNIEVVNNYVWIFDNLSAVQGDEIFAAATVKAVEDAGVFNTIRNHLDQDSSATSENPLDFITDLVGGFFGGITSSIWYTIMFIVFVIVVLTWAAGGRGGRRSRDDDDDDDDRRRRDDRRGYDDRRYDDRRYDDRRYDDRRGYDDRRYDDRRGYDDRYDDRRYDDRRGYDDRYSDYKRGRAEGSWVEAFDTLSF